MHFSHLHCHTQYSLLDGAADIKKLFKKAKADGQEAIAITDHGNMFGVFEFVAEGHKQGIKPIVGCEFYVVDNRDKRQFTKEQKDVRYHQLLLAKNEEGYKNLTKLCSLGYIEGMYGKYPRIDKELIVKYHKGLIATTCCIGASVPRTILKKGEDEGWKEFKWWKDLFQDDYYVEIQRHGIRDQNIVNEVLMRFAVRSNTKVICSNDSHYVEKDDANAHDILLCVNTGDKQSTPTNKDFDDANPMPKGTRFAFFNDEFYFKTKDEMLKTFSDIPESLDNTQDVVDKIDLLKLNRDILLPNFPIPDAFKIHHVSQMIEFNGKMKELTPDVHNQWEYLKHWTYEGAKKKYGEITSEISERLDFELNTIKNMGFPGYFLIVADFIQAGRDMGVLIGPGRGSAAGSAVAYAVGITNIDPIKYDLLFERFLNPDRISMPDIDTDFDDEGRQKVIDYVVQKYGKNQVAQIVTYGTMASKSAIKDVARVMDLPLNEANAVVKLVPDKPSYGINLNKVFNVSLEEMGKVVTPDELENLKKLREMARGTDLTARVFREAQRLEGTVRNVGIHAAGIIIAPSDLTDLIPVSTSKESELLITQYEGKIIEDAGVIKMDFLGLRNLTIIKEALRMIEANHGVKIDIDYIPLDDPKVYELFQRGETNAIFQFESDGMKKYMRELKPDRFGDLIAMNALYRPGPIAYIPNYINRKHGREKVEYDLPEMEEYLADTYGISTYQEQLMLLSQKLANFTKGDADVLRKAMGKKQIETLNKMKSKFIEGGTKNNLDPKKLDKVWTDWEAFASYAFNKSHSTCYAFVAYQTAYLKTHYPAEYMAAVLTSSLGNIDKITFFMEECKAMGLPVLGPDINESERRFGVNKRGEIRFGLGGIKGSGDAAVESIIDERKNGHFKDIFDFMTRVNLRTVNKKTLESLVYAGAFDCFDEFHRAQFFANVDNEQINFIEKLIKYANNYNTDKANANSSLFGAMGGAEMAIQKPKGPVVEMWGDIERLRFEKDVVGFYISGHPLDMFRLELDNFCTCTVDKLMRTSEIEENIIEEDNEDGAAIRNLPITNNQFGGKPLLFGKDVAVGGIVSSMQVRTTKTGNPFCIFKLEDYAGSIEMSLFGDDFVKYSNYVQMGHFLFIRGKIQNRWKSDDQYEFKPASMQLLQEVRDKLTKEVRLLLDLQLIDEPMVNQLNKLVQANKGNCALSVIVQDPENNSELRLNSRQHRISPSNAFFESLKALEGVSWRVN
jgi:DNA polymerase III subunit alpha